MGLFFCISATGENKTLGLRFLILLPFQPPLALTGNPMRRLLFSLTLVVVLGFMVPAQGQVLREGASQQVPVRVYGEGDGFSLNKLFSPEHFQLRHSYEMSYNSFGGQGMTLGTYTSSLMWQFNQKLAARADVAFSHTPFGTGAYQQALGEDSSGKVYLRNAEIAYRPTENMRLHLSFRQSPYGTYANPYGYGYAPYGGNGYSMRVQSGDADRLFWQAPQR